ncbi:alkaline phosphatase D family protein [Pseudoalteromonas sp.]|uniref:alkaline phosphatase D family protein n=1 Tax=Pseudoalteromonas sp. TaxID=53249 RepID=UPI003002F9A1
MHNSHTVKKLISGPNFGHKTASSFKVWGCCSKKGNWLLVIKVIAPDDSLIYQGQIPTLHKLKNVGFVEITGLEPSTSYSVFIGKAKALTSLDWTNISPLEVKTFPSSGSRTKFILTSCRHSDQLASFGNKNLMLNIMHKRLKQERDVDFRIACGDQVYADHPITYLSNNNPPKTFKGFAKHYFRNYNQAHNNVASLIPTYCTFDDHEVTNDWALSDFTDDHHKELKTKKDSRILNNGLLAYDAFQHALNPEFSIQDLESRIGADYISSKFKYWYTFQHSDIKFFAMDTRYQRIVGANFNKRNNDLEANDNNAFVQLIDPDTQMRSLKSFLLNNKDDVKFIISSMPFIPDTKPSGIGQGKAIATSPFDKWKGGHKQRKEILDFIKSNQIVNVFFLSGDVHCSFVAQVTHENKIVAYNIVSSALNWPTFGLGKASFQLGELFGAIEYSTSIISKKIYNESKTHIEKRNNYTEITVTNGNIEIDIINNLNKVSSSTKIAIT